eukprot:jgi/Chrzof1/10643/Cz05g06130.t1
MATLRATSALALVSIIALIVLTGPLSATARPLGVYDTSDSHHVRKLLDGGAGVEVNAVNQLSVSKSAADVSAAALVNTPAATKLATDSAVSSARLATRTATTGLFDNGRRLLANGGAGASGGTTTDGGVAAVNQLSVSKSAEDVSAAAQANTIAATKLGADSAVSSAQLASKTATTGLFDNGRRLLANGGAGASGGTTTDGGVAAVNQLSVSKSAEDVSAAAQANTIAATKLAADSAVSSAQLASKTATTGLFDNGRRLLQDGSSSSKTDSSDILNQLSVSKSSQVVSGAALANTAQVTQLAADGALRSAQAAARPGTDAKFFP